MNAAIFCAHPDEILQATFEHIWLVGIAMLLSVAVACHSAVLVARRPWLSKPILGLANIAETIPSLALLGILASRAVAGRSRGPAGDCGAGAVCAAADHSQHVRRESRASIRRYAKRRAAWA